MRKFVSILYLLTYCCVNNFAQGHSFKQFDLNDGLAGNIVYDIEQDALDYLWFGTNNGVSRYDGLNFQNYNDPILQNSDIILLEEMMGTMYFLNINRQLFCIQNNQIVPANAEIFKGPIYAFIHHPIGNCIWYSNQNNLFQYHLATKKSTRHEGLQNITGTSPHIFCLDQHQNLWVLSKEGIFKYQDSTTGLQKIVPAEAFPPNHNFNKISFQAKEGIYLTSSDDIAYRLSPNHQLQKIEKPILVTGNVGSYATTDDWWISNQKEVYRYHKATREVNDFTADVGYHQINKFYEDREGNIWFATDGNGLYMLNNPDVLNFNTRNSSLSSNQIQRIEVDPQQNVWLGLSDRNLMQLQGTNLQTFPYHPTRSNTQFYDLVFNQDTLFVIADRVYQVHAGKTSVFYPNQIKSFCVDSNNDIWMGAADLIFRRNRARQTDEVFMSNMRCYAIESTKEKTWFGTTRGLYFTNHDQSLNYHPKNKLAGWSLFKQQQRLDTS